MIVLDGPIICILVCNLLLQVASQQERKDAKDVLLAVMSQADTLARCVNDCLKVGRCAADVDDMQADRVQVADEEGDGGVGDVSSEERGLAARLTSERGVRLATPPSDKLVTITTSMNTNLTALLAIVQVIPFIWLGRSSGLVSPSPPATPSSLFCFVDTTLQDQEEEKQKLRKELQASQEQVRV